MATSSTADVDTPRSCTSETGVVSEERGYEYSNERYVPTYVTEAESPFMALRYMVDIEETLTESNKRGSLRKRFSKVDVRVTEASAALEALRDESRRVIAELSKTIDNFMALLVSVTRMRDRMQLQEARAYSEYLLIDDSVIEHPLLRQRKLGSSSLIADNGRLEMQKFINAKSWKENYTRVEASRRINTIFKNANHWLADACKGVCDIFAVLPVAWQLDSNNAKLSNEAISDRAMRASLELPFLMIGMLDAMRLHEFSEEIIRSLVRRFI